MGAFLVTRILILSLALVCSVLLLVLSSCWLVSAVGLGDFGRIVLLLLSAVAVPVLYGGERGEVIQFMEPEPVNSLYAEQLATEVRELERVPLVADNGVLLYGDGVDLNNTGVIITLDGAFVAAASRRRLTVKTSANPGRRKTADGWVPTEPKPTQLHALRAARQLLNENYAAELAAAARAAESAAGGASSSTAHPPSSTGFAPMVTAQLKSRKRAAEARLEQLAADQKRVRESFDAEQQTAREAAVIEVRMAEAELEQHHASVSTSSERAAREQAAKAAAEAAAAKAAAEAAKAAEAEAEYVRTHPKYCRAWDEQQWNRFETWTWRRRQVSFERKPARSRSGVSRCVCVCCLLADQHVCCSLLAGQALRGQASTAAHADAARGRGRPAGPRAARPCRCGTGLGRGLKSRRSEAHLQSHRAARAAGGLLAPLSQLPHTQLPHLCVDRMSCMGICPQPTPSLF